MAGKPRQRQLEVLMGHGDEQPDQRAFSSPRHRRIPPWQLKRIRPMLVSAIKGETFGHTLDLRGAESGAGNRTGRLARSSAYAVTGSIRFGGITLVAPRGGRAAPAGNQPVGGRR